MFLNDLVSVMLKVSSALSRERPKLHVTKRKDALGANEAYGWESSNSLKAEKAGNRRYLSLRYSLHALGLISSGYFDRHIPSSFLWMFNHAAFTSY